MDDVRTVAEPHPLEVPPDEWDGLLAYLEVRDVYYSRGYLEASAVIEPGRPVLLHYSSGGGHIVYPLILRDVTGEGLQETAGLTDTITPYGYGGPLAIGDAPPVDLFAADFAEWCAHNRVVSSFIRFHPLLANHEHALADTVLCELAGTVAWDVSSERELFENLHRHHRRSVRKALEAGVQVRVQESADSLPAFRALYEETMRRQRAKGFYFFPDEYWQALQEKLDGTVMLFGAWHDDELVACLCCFARRPWLHYHLGASSDAARSLGASNLLFFSAATWAQGNGYERFHLGGGVGGAADSLYDFKLRFDPSGAVPAYVGKQIIDAEAYERLSGTADTSGFFPAYRAPH